MTQKIFGGLVLLLIALSIPVAFYAFGFQLGFGGDPDFYRRFAAIPIFAGMHVLGAGVALLLGGFQFVGKIRNKAINVHRWSGRIYLTAVLIGGIGGLVLAGQATGGPVARIGFGMLAVTWLYSGAQAYAAVRAGDIASHQLWMARNFSLTFAAVTLRIYLGVLQGPFELTFEEAYPVVAWLAWVPNLILVEWFIATRSRGSAVVRGQDQAISPNFP